MGIPGAELEGQPIKVEIRVVAQLERWLGPWQVGGVRLAYSRLQYSASWWAVVVGGQSPVAVFFFRFFLPIVAALLFFFVGAVRIRGRRGSGPVIVQNLSKAVAVDSHALGRGDQLAVDHADVGAGRGVVYVDSSVDGPLQQLTLQE